MSKSYTFHEVYIRADWQDWTFGAHQAAARTAAIEELIALRRQYTEMSEQDVVQLANSWRSDDTSGPYFVFAAASSAPDDQSGAVAVGATFIRELFQQLADQAPEALAALLDQWAEQRGYATQAGMRPVPVRPPRVSVLLPRDASQWPPASWDALLALDLDEPRFDGTLLHWDSASSLWLVLRPQHVV